MRVEIWSDVICPGANQEKRGVQDEVVEALYKAHFTDRRSVFDQRLACGDR